MKELSIILFCILLGYLVVFCVMTFDTFWGQSAFNDPWIIKYLTYGRRLYE